MQLVKIYLITSDKTELKKRLVKRNQNTEEEIKKRSDSFDEDIKHWNDYDYIIINQNLANCFRQIEKINALNKTKLIFSFQKSVWADEKDISDENTIIEICKSNNFDSSSIIEDANSEDIISEYKNNTEEALSKNVWGSPTFIYNNELFWGQDRIDFLERAIQNN